MAKILIVGLFCIGLWGILAGRSLIRKIIGLTIFNSSLVVLFIISGRLDGTAAPLLTIPGEPLFVDPLPQALMLTAIVVGLSVTAVALILAVKLYRSCGTLDVREIEDCIHESEH
ncbi:MAG TPA: Na+/H+ antiporter subunit C [Sediminispirochaeta sp.]|nr:Na+/H+ antiporter subunit C [Sediminispirochaeta sp.]